jgi:hypothetical protein
MAAIITDDFRRNQAQLLINDIKASVPLSAPDSSAFRDNENYSLGLGKTNPWPNDSAGNAESSDAFIVDAPIGTEIEKRDVIDNLFTLKELAADSCYRMIPRNNWVSGRKYKVYNYADNDCFYATGDLYPSYVTHNSKVYVCLSNHSSQNTGSASDEAVIASSSSPDTNNASDFGITSTPGADGYIWAHVQTLPSSGTIAKLITSQFVPIQDATFSAAMDSNSGGFIYDIGLVSGGSGYSSSVTATLTAVDADGAKVTSNLPLLEVKQTGGVITSINLRRPGISGDAGTATNAGSRGYWSHTVGNRIKDILSATVTITDSSGTGAVAVVSLTPQRGLGANALEVLPTFYVGITADFANDEGGDSPILNFRQVSLIKSATVTDSNTTGTHTALKSITLGTPNTSALGGLTPGTVLKQGDSKFYFNEYDSGTAKLFYHQNSDQAVNYIKPQVSSDDVTSEDGVTSYADEVTAVSEGEFQKTESLNSTEEYNGEVIFHENRTPFTRTSSQTEEVKLIIQL